MNLVVITFIYRNDSEDTYKQASNSAINRTKYLTQHTMQYNHYHLNQPLGFEPLYFIHVKKYNKEKNKTYVQKINTRKKQ